MRPVNLIPPEERQGDRNQARTGVAMYALLGGLAAALLGVTLMVTTGNSISERKGEKQRLTALKAAVDAQAGKLAAYRDFRDLQQKRVATVSQLAQSRFDWERVLRELALIVPDDVWFTNVKGTVSPLAEVEGDPTIDLRDKVAGPALEFAGCGRNHESVARFIARLRNIDGVTRVAVSKSERPDDDGDKAGGGGGAGSDDEDDCRVHDSIPRFEVIAAFDAVVVDQAAVAPAPGSGPPPTTEQSEAARVKAEADKKTRLLPGAGT